MENQPVKITLDNTTPELLTDEEARLLTSLVGWARVEILRGDREPSDTPLLISLQNKLLSGGGIWKRIVIHHPNIKELDEGTFDKFVRTWIDEVVEPESRKDEHALFTRWREADNAS